MVLSDCVCPGHELRLECTVVGGGSIESLSGGEVTLTVNITE